MIQDKLDRITFSPTLIKALRLVWLLLFVILSAVFIAGIPLRYNELAEVCPADPCILTLRTEEAQILADLGLSMPLFAVYHLGIEIATATITSLLAVFFFWRRFDEPMGILLAFMLILFGLNFMVESDGSAIHNYPQFQIIQNIISSLTTIPLILLIYTFPDGRFVPRWSRIILPLTIIIAIADPLLLRFNLDSPSGQMTYVLLIFIIPAIIIGIGTQIYRYRSVSGPVQRQQTKWVVLGFAALLVPILGWSLFIELFPPPPGGSRLLFFTVVYGIMAAFLSFFPISFVIAITRYRLWDIDLLIRRTLVYSALTGTLILVYFGSVVVVQTAVNSLTGRTQSSQLTIALSTLLIAALFAPLRRRVQAFIDRRFYRRKYDAVQTLARFASSARDEVEIDQIQQALAQVVTETLQPTYFSLWLKPEEAEKEAGPERFRNG